MLISCPAWENDPVILFIPSPPVSAFQIGPVTIHIYALCLIAGIGLAWWLGERRWRDRGGDGDDFEYAVFWAIPIGILGARFYHVLTHLGDYFGPGRNPWSAFFIWEGGIAIFGAIGFGALAAYLACRRKGIRMSTLADCVAPGIAFAQAVGRFGNWFNQELYGWPTTEPWGLEIDAAHRLPGYEQYATFQPMFAYEAIWNVAVGVALLLVDRRFKLGRGKLFALYAALYGLGRSVTEGVRLDYSYDTFGPVRFNQAVAMLICVGAVAVFFWLLKNRPGSEESVRLHPEDATAPDMKTQEGDDPHTPAVAGFSTAITAGEAARTTDVETPDVETTEDAPETVDGADEDASALPDDDSEELVVIPAAPAAGDDGEKDRSAE